MTDPARIDSYQQGGHLKIICIVKSGLCPHFNRLNPLFTGSFLCRPTHARRELDHQRLSGWAGLSSRARMSRHCGPSVVREQVCDPALPHSLHPHLGLCPQVSFVYMSLPEMSLKWFKTRGVLMTLRWSFEGQEVPGRVPEASWGSIYHN